MANWQRGDRVFAYWQDDEYYYPATIIGIEGNDIQIRYDTGDEETTSAENLEELVISVDEQYECLWSEDEDYYDAKIAAVAGENVEVVWDEDGTREWVTASALRYWYEE